MSLCLCFQIVMVVVLLCFLWRKAKVTVGNWCVTSRKKRRVTLIFDVLMTSVTMSMFFEWLNESNLCFWMNWKYLEDLSSKVGFDMCPKNYKYRWQEVHSSFPRSCPPIHPSHPSIHPTIHPSIHATHTGTVVQYSCVRVLQERIPILLGYTFHVKDPYMVALGFQDSLDIVVLYVYVCFEGIFCRYVLKVFFEGMSCMVCMFRYLYIHHLYIHHLYIHLGNHFSYLWLDIKKSSSHGISITRCTKRSTQFQCNVIQNSF